SESGHHIQKNPPMAGFSLSGVRTLHRTAFDYSAKGLTLRASAKALFNAAPAPVIRVRSPYLENPPMAGFSLSGVRTLHRTAFDYSAKGLTLRASAETLNTEQKSSCSYLFNLNLGLYIRSLN
ncbi:hypothetical protein, partial [Serratia ureilytica]|uniref:hypothetical protein n=1 Tax=Serratia ureilytica TaxID=300181 RepID=UPI001E3BCF82